MEHIEASLKLHLLQLIFEWSLLEEWVFPTVSIYANDITFHLTIHNMSAWLEDGRRDSREGRNNVEKERKKALKNRMMAEGD